MYMYMYVHIYILTYAYMCIFLLLALSLLARANKHIRLYICIHIHKWHSREWFVSVRHIHIGVWDTSTYGVATMSRLLKIIGLFCKRALWNRLYSAKETYIFKEPINRSHPIGVYVTHAKDPVIYAYIYACICLCVYVYIYICTCVYMNIYIYVCIYTFIHTCIYVYIYTHIHDL